MHWDSATVACQKIQQAEIRRAAAKGICSLMKRAPQPELRKAQVLVRLQEVSFRFG